MQKDGTVTSETLHITRGNSEEWIEFKNGSLLPKRNRVIEGIHKAQRCGTRVLQALV